MKNVITISRQMGSGGRVVGGDGGREAGLAAGRQGDGHRGGQAGGTSTRQDGDGCSSTAPACRTASPSSSSSGKYLDAINAGHPGVRGQGERGYTRPGSPRHPADDPNVFRVHLVADLETTHRAHRRAVRTEGEEGAGGGAHATVIDSDYARTAYHNYLFDVDWNDPLLLRPGHQHHGHDASNRPPTSSWRRFEIMGRAA